MIHDPFGALLPSQRQALLERLGLTLRFEAQRADCEGDRELGSLMYSVGDAILESAEDLSNSELRLANEVSKRAIALLAAFRDRYPSRPTIPYLH